MALTGRGYFDDALWEWLSVKLRCEVFECPFSCDFPGAMMAYLGSHPREVFVSWVVHMVRVFGKSFGG
jgi:hypothetical protein